jgi:circadian clock protein KaiB
MAKTVDIDTKTPADPNKPLYEFVLFVAGASPHSLRAINNLQEICDAHFAGNYQIEVIDVYKDPEGAKDRQIIALPLLIRKHPQPERRLIGDLSDTDKVVKTLSIIT